MLRKASVRKLTAKVILPLGDLSTKNQGFSIVRHIESRRSLSFISLNCTVLNGEDQGILTFEKLERVIDLPPQKNSHKHFYYKILRILRRGESSQAS